MIRESKEYLQMNGFQPRQECEWEIPIIENGIFTPFFKDSIQLAYIQSTFMGKNLDWMCLKAKEKCFDQWDVLVQWKLKEEEKVKESSMFGDGSLRDLFSQAIVLCQP